MRPFSCTHCQQIVFFENSACVACGAALGFAPDSARMLAFSGDPTDDTAGAEEYAPLAGYRPCANRARYGICNWLVAADDDNELCCSCRLTDQDALANASAMHDRISALEQAKRRLLFTLLQIGLMPEPKHAPDDPGGLRFHYALSSDPAQPVLTGHANGTITINLAEADAVEREKQRVAFGEPVRSLLGHMRHEVSHYLQYRWIDPHPALQEHCRAVFGDERADYAAALANYHANGPLPDWESAFISAYASAHPWEDWAETCAHLLLVIDAVETAAAWGLKLDSPASSATPEQSGLEEGVETLVLEHWLPVAQFLNAMNRSLGLPDGYPYLIPNPVLHKMQTARQLLAEASRPQ